MVETSCSIQETSPQRAVYCPVMLYCDERGLLSSNVRSSGDDALCYVSLARELVSRGLMKTCTLIDLQWNVVYIFKVPSSITTSRCWLVIVADAGPHCFVIDKHFEHVELCFAAHWPELVIRDRKYVHLQVCICGAFYSVQWNERGLQSSALCKQVYPHLTNLEKVDAIYHHVMEFSIVTVLWMISSYFYHFILVRVMIDLELPGTLSWVGRNFLWNSWASG